MATSKSKDPSGTKKIPTSELVQEALRQTEDRQGLSLRGILAFIDRTHPALCEKPGFNSRVKKSLISGLEKGTLKRPKKSLDCPGVTGYFKLGDKAKKATETKTKKTSRSRSASPHTKKSATIKKTKTAQTKAKAGSKSRSRSLSKSPSKAKATKTKASASAKSRKASKSPRKKITAKSPARKTVVAAKKPAKPKPKKGKSSA